MKKKWFEMANRKGFYNPDLIKEPTSTSKTVLYYQIMVNYAKVGLWTNDENNDNPTKRYYYI